MALINRERHPGTYEVTCSRCGAETISTGSNDTPLCLICRAVILALNFQAAETNRLKRSISITPGENSQEIILQGDLSEGADHREGAIMKREGEKGKVGYIILWFLGVPISVLLLIALLRAC